MALLSIQSIDAQFEVYTYVCSGAEILKFKSSRKKLWHMIALPIQYLANSRTQMSLG
jgi:hypothetical protein